MPIKIAFIGAGSIGFTRRLVRDVLAVPELAATRFAFTDINERNLEMVTALCRRDIEHNRLPATIDATNDRRRALADADFVICCIRQGGLEAFATDIDIPLQYGVDQCVGDTLCAGGIFYAQRGIPAILDFCRDIREVARPGAMLLNYANPMAMLTWAANQFGSVPTVGLCHGVQGAHWQIAAVIEHFARTAGLRLTDAADEATSHTDYASGHTSRLHRRHVTVAAVGINHQTWFTDVRWRGIDFIADPGSRRSLDGVEFVVPSLLQMFEAHPRFPTTEKVRIDVLRRFGLYSTESNGHLSEYVPWYRKRTDEIGKWIDLSNWINGETGGYLRVCTEGRDWFETDFPNWMQQTPPAIAATDRSEEHGSYIIEAIVTGRPYRGHFNVINRGHVPNLPAGCVVEIPGYVDGLGVHCATTRPLPMACAATCAASVRVQEMAVHAAVAGDVTLLKQAMLHDPLVGAVCDPEEVWQMADEMLVAQAGWLPQYAGEIAGARSRLSAAEEAGTRVRLRQTRGAARLHTKTVAEMSADRDAARKNAAAADKGDMTHA